MYMYIYIYTYTYIYIYIYIYICISLVTRALPDAPWAAPAAPAMKRARDAL